MNRKRLILLHLLVFVASLSVRAEVLTIEQCRRMALENNRKLKIADLVVQQAELTRRSAYAMFFPEFSLSGVAAYSTASGAFGMDISDIRPVMQTLGPAMVSNALQTAVQNGTLSPAAAAQMGQSLSDKIGRLPSRLDVLDYEVGFLYHGGVVMKQPLYMGGKIRAGYKMSRLAVDLYRQNVRKTQAEVIEEADQAYAMLVKANELKTVAEKYHEALKELDRTVESAVLHGMRLENDRLKVQVKLSEAELQIRRAENGIRLSQMNLCHVIGLPLTEMPAVSNRYPQHVETLSGQMDSDIMQRPEYAILEGQVQIEEQKVKAVRSAMLPQVALLASYGYTGGFKVNDVNILDDASFTGGVTLNVPLYHFGERTGKVKAAKLKAGQTRLEMEEKAELMRLELLQCANTLDESQLECRLAEKSLQQAEKSMHTSEKLYKAGTEPLTDYLEAQVLWQKAWETRVEAYFQRYLAGVRYLKAAGCLVSY